MGPVRVQGVIKAGQAKIQAKLYNTSQEWLSSLQDYAVLYIFSGQEIVICLSQISQSVTLQTLTANYEINQ